MILFCLVDIYFDYLFFKGIVDFMDDYIFLGLDCDEVGELKEYFIFLVFNLYYK